jgi:hypothetical protein
MANDMVPLANGITLSAVSSVSFTSISGDYKDLFLVCETAISSGSTGVLRISMNSNSPATNRVIITGRDGAQTTSTGASIAVSGTFSNPNTRCAVSCSILDYAVTDKGKVAIVRTGGSVDNTGDNTSLVLLGQNTTSAITSITISFSSGNIPTGSFFALYGIR